MNDVLRRLREIRREKGIEIKLKTFDEAVDLIEELERDKSNLITYVDELQSRIEAGLKLADEWEADELVMIEHGSLVSFPKARDVETCVEELRDLLNRDNDG